MAPAQTASISQIETVCTWFRTQSGFSSSGEFVRDSAIYTYRGSALGSKKHVTVISLTFCSCFSLYNRLQRRHHHSKTVAWLHFPWHRSYPSQQPPHPRGHLVRCIVSTTSFSDTSPFSRSAQQVASRTGARSDAARSKQRRRGCIRGEGGRGRHRSGQQRIRQVANRNFISILLYYSKHTHTHTHTHTFIRWDDK